MLDGNSTITKNLFDVVRILFPVERYPRFFETGSGKGTKAWVGAGYSVTSVEHDEKWLNFVEGSKYIHAPLAGKYYDREIIKEVICCEFFDIWLLDGPPGHISNRVLICDIFGDVAFLEPRVFVVDDCHREDGRLISQYLLKRYPTALMMTVPNTDPKGYRHDANIFVL